MMDFMQATKLKTIEEFLTEGEKPKCLIVDIDGTIAKMGDRNPFDWKKVGLDFPNKEIISEIRKLVKENPELFVFFITGREGAAHKETRKWIQEHLPFLEEDFRLLMRKDGDRRKNAVVKKELFYNNIEGKFIVDLAFEDDEDVIKLWKSFGIPVREVSS